MKVAIYTHMGLPHVGGSEYYVHGLALSLNTHGEQARVYTGGDGPSEIDGVRYIRGTLKDGWADIHIVLGTRNWIYDSIMPIHPVICIPCGDGPPRHPVDHVVAFTLHEQLQYRGATLIPPGINYREFMRHIGGDGNTCLYIGGDYSHKRLSLIREACQIGGMKLITIGNGLEVLDRKSVLKNLAKADVLCLASTHEGFGIVLLEALASGLPWVSTNVGGASELPGGIVVPIDVKAEKLNVVIQTSTTVKVNRGLAKRWDWSYLVGDWLNLLREQRDKSWH